MILSGYFKDRLDDDISVVITTPASSSDASIGNDLDDDLQFAADPLTISCDMDETMDVLVLHSCTLTLQVKSYLADTLFTGNERDITLKVYKNGVSLFEGYVEPNVFTQPYDHTWNQLSINATDILSTLQYRAWRNIKNLSDWARFRTAAGQISLLEIIQLIFTDGAPGLEVYYDGSVRLNQNAPALSIFDVLINEQLFLGDELDDCLQTDEVLEMVLKYFNLHIRQEGNCVYIYHNNSLKQSSQITWTPVLSYSPDCYILAQDDYVLNTFTGNAYEKLVSASNPQNSLRGKLLQKELSHNPERRLDDYVYFYYWILPSGRRVKSIFYELTDQSDEFEYIRKPLEPEKPYRILNQNEYGDYVFKELDTAPNSAYSGNTFTKPYFQAADGEYIVTNR